MELIYIGLIILWLLIAVPTARAAIIGAPFFWTPRKAITEGFKKAEIKKEDKVYELGFGSGRALFEAQKLGANVCGFELSPLAYYFVKFLIYFRKKTNIQIHRKNFYNADLRNADVVYCFLTPKAMEKLRDKFEKELKKGTRVISYSFSIKNWEPSEVIKKYPGKVFIYRM